MLNAFQPWHLIIVLVLLVLLFGAKRLPDAARSVGKSMKIFKAETKSMHESGEPAEDHDAKQLPAATVQPTGTDAQVAELQRQLDELKKQKTQEDQPHKRVS
jgi:sec-independent protein translocase protein TatA